MGWAGDGPAVGLPKSGITMVVTSYFSKLDTQDALSQRSSLVATGALLAVALLISGASLPDSGEEAFASRADTSLVLRAYELGIHERPRVPDVSTPSAPRGYDARYYRIELDIDFDARIIHGRTRADVMATSSLSRIDLDFASNMNVERVRLLPDGGEVSFEHEADILSVILPAAAGQDERVSVEVDYSGRPEPTGFGAFVFDVVAGTPVAWSLSEPWGARQWWPSNDHPSDKADSVRVVVTVPEGMSVGSNGVLESVETSAGRTTFNWIERYPISTYLVSIAAGNYRLFEQAYSTPDTIDLGGSTTQMPIVHYRYERPAGAALPSGWAEVLDALPVFEWWFGRYPFASEKYGHIEFSWRGGMEHQTLSSMGGDEVALMAHELAHQWFGDAVTLESWPHLWLNEGFASYAELLYWEAMVDRYPDAFRAGLAADHQLARTAEGTLVARDTTSIDRLFASNRVYAKGSAVLHMLRKVVGDNAFRTVLQRYAGHPSLQYGTATTGDFRRVAESVHGGDLSWFFEQWVTEGTGFPQYEADYWVENVDEGYDVRLQLRQTQSPPESNTDVFIMPIEIEIEHDSGIYRSSVWNDRRVQNFVFTVPDLPRQPRIDPGADILRGAAIPVTLSPDAPLGYSATAYPNPTSSVVTLQITVDHTGPAILSVYDVLGREVMRPQEHLLSRGYHRLDIDLSDLTAGRYLIRLDVGGEQVVVPITRL